MIDSVAVIESLSGNDTLTGKSLSEMLSAKGFKAGYRSVDTQKEFIQAIQEVGLASRQERTRSALHFEVHGDDQGFHLTDGTHVPWQEVKQDIQGINLSQRNQLLVSMAVCEGLWLLRIISATDRSPFSTLVANQHEIYENSIKNGFAPFYEALLSGKGVEEALRHLNSHQHKSQPAYRAVTSEEKFRDAYSRYLRELSSPDNLVRRAQSIFDQCCEEGYFTPAQREPVTACIVRTLKERERPTFERFRSQFFMHDLYPENSAEFCPTFEACSGPV